MIRPMIARVGQGRFRRSMCALVDPLLEECDLLGRQRRAFILRRHATAGLAGEHRNEVTVGRLARHNRRARIAAGDQFGRRIDPQPRLLSQGTVTRVAARDENRLDLLDVVDLVTGHRNRRQEQEGRNENDEPSHATPEGGLIRQEGLLEAEPKVGQWTDLSGKIGPLQITYWTLQSSASFENVGWVEFYETHQFPMFMVGLAELDPPYNFRGLRPHLFSARDIACSKCS